MSYFSLPFQIPLLPFIIAPHQCKYPFIISLRRLPLTFPSPNSGVVKMPLLSVFKFTSTVLHLLPLLFGLLHCLRVSRPLASSQSYSPSLFSHTTASSQCFSYSSLPPVPQILSHLSSPCRKKSSADSPDSMLKKSLLPADALYHTNFSTGTTKSLSSSLRTDCSFVPGKKNLAGSTRGHSNNLASSPAPSPIELISRRPDGHFVLPTVDSSAIIVHDNRQMSDWTSSDQSSASLDLDEEDGKPLAFVLSVDLPARCKTEAYPLLQPPIDDDLNADGVSTCSRGSWVTQSNHKRAMPFTFPVLPHIRSCVVQPSVTSSALLLQMEHERERGNLSHCLKLAHEREELEKELRKYTLEKRSPVGGQAPRQRSEAAGYRFPKESRSNTLPHRHTLGGRVSAGLPPSPFALSSVHWEADTHVSSPTLIPVINGTSAPISRNPRCVMTGAHPSASSSLNACLLQSEEMGALTLPHLSSEVGQPEMAQAAVQGHDQSPHSSRDSSRQSSRSHSSVHRLPFHTDRCLERAQSPPGSISDTSRDELGLLGITVKNGCVEMSVDEPELEVSLTQPPPRPMLHQRIALHLERGRPHTRSERCGAIGRSATFSGHSPQFPLSPQFRETQIVRDVPQSWDMKHRSKSLDFRRRKKATFLTPDAWISSLSQENCSLSSSHYLELSSSLPRDSGSTANTSGAGACPRNIPEMHNEVFYHDDHEALADWPTVHPEVAGGVDGSLEGMKAVLTAGLPHDTDPDMLEVEAGGSEGVPDSRSSYSSYASSGRGSMEAAGGRISLCRLSPVLSNSPETVGRSRGNKDEHGLHTEPSLRYE